MSGLCGVVRLDGRAVAPDELRPVLDALRYRGPEREGKWRNGPVGLGHALLATTPEAAIEPMPLIHQESGCAITADVRLDNRDELIPVLAPEATAIGDGELVLRAYLRWSEDCVHRLLGDFAFAIWDGRHQRLFAARDPMGVRQLCFAHVDRKAFVFATDPQAVIRHRDVSDRLYEARIAQFLAGLETAAPDRSFFAAVMRLQAAHSLRIDRGGELTIRRHWRPERQPTLRLKSDAEYGEALLEQLRRAVGSRLRSVTPIGVMMSGGMDSTAVAAIGAGLLAEDGKGPLDAFSVIDSADPACVESRAIRAAQGIAGIRPHLIDIARGTALSERLQRATRELADPFDWIMSIPRVVYAEAQQRGVNVILDGMGADSLLWTQGLIAALLRRGRFAQAWNEAMGEQQFWGGNWAPWRSFGRGLIWAYAKPAWALREWVGDRRAGRALIASGRIKCEFADSTELEHVRDRFRREELRRWKIGPGAVAAQLAGPTTPVARERYDRVAAGFSVEARDPFLDRRMVEFAISLPPEQLQRGGFPKLILRNAMAGLVPDAVRWRRGKEHLGWTLSQRLAGSGDDLPSGKLEEFVDVADVKGGPDIEHRALANWLRQYRRAG